MSNISPRTIKPAYHTGSVFGMMSRLNRTVFRLVTVIFFMIALIFIFFGFFTVIPLILKDFDLVLCLVLAFIVLYGMLLLYFL